MKRPDETPLRRRTGVVGPEASPGTPPSRAGDPSALRIIRPTDVAIQKFANRYKRLLNLGTASPFDGYLSDLLPAVLLDLFGVEQFFPDDQIMWGTGVSAAAAANFSKVALQNPVGSRKLGIISYISASATVATTLGLFTDTNGAYATLTRAFERDGRIAAWAPAGGGGAGGVLLIRTDNLGAITGQGPVQQKTVGVNVVAEWTGSGESGIVVLAPGQDLIVTPGIVNIGVTAEFRWREIALPVG